MKSKKIKENFKLLESSGSYDPKLERDACGVGLVAKITGEASHEIVEKSLKALCNLEHRGASGADKETGDGAGILLQIPHDYFYEELKKSNIILKKDNYGTGVLFCGKNEHDSEKIKKIFENCVEELGLKVFTWRDVPIAPDKIGKTAREIMPILQQVFVGSEGDDIIDDIEQKLFIIRKKFENIIKFSIFNIRYYFIIIIYNW